MNILAGKLCTTIMPLFDDRDESRTEQAVAKVLESIFGGDFHEGDHLTEASLSQLLGMSRTPIRGALLELKGLGVLEVRRNRGAIVTQLSEVKLREIFEVRRILEVEATRKSSGRINAQTLGDLLKAIRQLLESGGEDGDWELDQRIHTTIAESCGNRRLQHEIKRYDTLMQAIRKTVGKRMPVHRITAEQHLDILTAIANHQPDAAAAAMRIHLEQAEESAVAAIA